MRRERIAPRADWQQRCEELGFSYHTIDGTYWDESACYEFSADEIDVLEAAADSLHDMCLEACDVIVRQDRFAQLAIAPPFAALVERSWRAREPSLFGRFDLAWNGSGAPKLLEYNADTPTSLLEASVVQWQWMQDAKPGTDQFNSLHERLIARWAQIREQLGVDAAVFTCVRDNDEDLGNLEYLRDTAIQAEFATSALFIDTIGWDSSRRRFVDAAGAPIDLLVKLYPWEWLAAEPFGVHLTGSPCRMIEPAWKMMLSNKGLLPILWELFPGHENLLPAHFEPGKIVGDYVRKPLLSREGANVALRRSAGAMISEGTYGAEGHVYQAFTPLACTDGNYAVLGAWIIGDDPAGLGIREDATPITRNTSRFVPHYFI